MMIENAGGASRAEKIAVYGASGHTGRLVAGELLRRGFDVIYCGRESEGMDRFVMADPAANIRLASIDDPASLDRAFDGACLVINCAGPFLDTARPVIEAALRSRTAYVDVAPEQASALATFQENDEAARNAGVAVVPGFGFYGGLADLLATAAMGDWEFADEIRVGTALDSWHPTPGTRLTGKRNTFPRFVLAGGRFEQLSTPPREGRWNFPPPFGTMAVIETPLSEIVTMSRHLRVPEIRAYMNEAPLLDLRDPMTPPPSTADESGRSSQTFVMDVTVRKGKERRRMTAHGRDIYATTAPMVAEAAERILDPRFEATGARAAAEIFEARAFLQALAGEFFHLGSSRRSAALSAELSATTRASALPDVGKQHGRSAVSFDQGE